MHAVSLDTASLELARRAILNTAASDLRHAAELLERIGEAAWPVSAIEVEDAQAALRRAYESAWAIEGLGWPVSHVRS